MPADTTRSISCSLMLDKELQLWSVPIIHCNEKFICLFQCHKAVSEEGQVGVKKKWVIGHRHKSVGQQAQPQAERSSRSVPTTLSDIENGFGLLLCGVRSWI